MLHYKGLKGTYERLIVSDAQVDRQIEALIEQHPRIIPVTDRPSRLDDEVVLDYAGYCDGVQFEGGTAQDQTLVLGSGTFIPGFEDQLVGKQPGDDVLVRVTFPAPYHSEVLAGKEAMFKCKLKAIRQREKYTPDDAFAKEIGGFDSFAALREAMRKGLQAYADRQADEDLKLKLLDQLVLQYDGEITPKQLDGAVDGEIQSLQAQLARQGLTLDAYCQFTGKTKEQLRQDMLPDARKGIVRQRIIAQIVDAEKIEADEASVSAAIQQICRENGMSVEQLSAHLDENAQRAIVQNVVTQKALDALRDSAVIETVEKKAE